MTASGTISNTSNHCPVRMYNIQSLMGVICGTGNADPFKTPVLLPNISMKVFPGTCHVQHYIKYKEKWKISV
jgi:hypothetical protein